MGDERSRCSTCNSEPGDRTKITFTDNEKYVTIRLCEECYTDFAADDGIDLTLVEE